MHYRKLDARYRQQFFNPAHLLRGFSFIEILVVVAIMALMIAVVAPNIIGEVDEAAIVKAKADVQAVVTALNMYKLDNYNYPSTEQGLQALVSKPNGEPPAANWKTGGYLGALPKDPWGKDYQYIRPGQHGEIDVFSFGADGQPGGEGKDADFGNWATP